jgi:hypothetical protein
MPNAFVRATEWLAKRILALLRVLLKLPLTKQRRR